MIKEEFEYGGGQETPESESLVDYVAGKLNDSLDPNTYEVTTNGQVIKVQMNGAEIGVVSFGEDGSFNFQAIDPDAFADVQTLVTTFVDEYQNDFSYDGEEKQADQSEIGLEDKDNAFESYNKRKAKRKFKEDVNKQGEADKNHDWESSETSQDSDFMDQDIAGNEKDNEDDESYSSISISDEKYVEEEDFSQDAHNSDGVDIVIEPSDTEDEEKEEEIIDKENMMLGDESEDKDLTNSYESFAKKIIGVGEEDLESDEDDFDGDKENLDYEDEKLEESLIDYQEGEEIEKYRDEIKKLRAEIKKIR
jgi:hypothetical protein